MRALVLLLLAAGAANAQEFRYDPPGQLVAGSGQGRVDDRVYVPGMRFPIEQGPAFANSQVWGHGGLNGPGGGQCDAANYAYPWRDNYCETRQWDMPLCPAGTGHQGQDIRPSTCENRRHRTVAAEDGVISSIGTYSVSLMADRGTLHRYLHMDPASLAVREGQRVRRGDPMGLVSNAFGDTPTTIHLHYDLQQNVNGMGRVFVPTYLSLVRSYEELLGRPAEPCGVVPAAGGVVDDQGACFHAFGPPATWRTADAGNDGRLHWTYAWVNATPGNWARFDLHLAAAGRYRVSVNAVAGFNGSRRALYRLRHGGQETDVVVDLQAGGPWVEVATVAFAAGGDQWLEVYDNTGENRDLELQIVADAVRLTPDAPPPPPDAGLPADAGEPVDGALAPDAARPDAARPDAGRPDGGRPGGADADVRPDPARRDAGDPRPDGQADGGDFRVPAARFDDGCRAQPGSPGAPALLLLALAAIRRRR
ncbi:MAG: peptidoglycan DD-metalloendopeptidase family protein [bacterium]